MGASNDVIMEAIVREVKRTLRKETTAKVGELRRENTVLNRKLKKLQKLEREFKTQTEKLNTERGRVRTLATKIIREYDKIISLKKKPVGNLMSESYDWRRISRERGAVVSLRKAAIKG